MKALLLATLVACVSSCAPVGGNPTAATAKTPVATAATSSGSAAANPCAAAANPCAAKPKS